MTQNKRIALNVIATYARSLYGIVIGLIAGRWTLLALGQTDYGLYALVGGLAVFVSFLNGLMSTAVSRFYAYSIVVGNNVSKQVVIYASNYDKLHRHMTLALQGNKYVAFYH